jgi:hypothetical protein
MQYGDMSGTWGTEQKEMIKQMGINQNDNHNRRGLPGITFIEPRDSWIASHPFTSSSARALA